MIRKLLLLSLLATTSAHAAEVWTDGAYSTLAEDLDTTETGIDLVSGAAFPTTPGGSDYFQITVRSVSTPTTFEVMRCTARATNTLTCSRDCTTGTCDGTGIAFSTGDNVYHSVTRSTLARTNGAGSAAQITYHGSDGFPGGLSLVDGVDGRLRLEVENALPTVAAGNLGIQAHGPTGMPPFLAVFANATRTMLGPDQLMWSTSGVAPGLTTLVNTFGHTTYSANEGTLSTPAPASTSALTRRVRSRVTSGAVAGDRAAFRQNASTWFRDGTNPGFLVQIAGVSTPVLPATPQIFFGVSDRGTVLTNPSNAINLIAMAVDDTDANWQIMHNDGSGTATRIDLGANFPLSTTSFFDVWFYAPPSSATVYYYVRRLDAAFEASGTITTNLPLSTQALGLYQNARNGATASAIAIEFSQIFGASPREGVY